MFNICDSRKFLSRQIFDLRACGFLRSSHNSFMPMENHIEWLNAKLAEMPHGTKKELAEFMGIDSSKLSKSLRNARDMSASELEKAVAFFHDAPESLRTPQRLLPIVGLAGAGPDGTVHFGDGDGSLGYVAAPEGTSANAEALEVRGNSMRGMAEDGWIIFYEDKEPPSEEHMGEPCVCFLEDDRVLIKTPYPGRQSGLFDLESVNAPTMRDIPVRYFAFITDIKPRRSARKFMRNNPASDVREVTLAGRQIAKPA